MHLYYSLLQDFLIKYCPRWDKIANTVIRAKQAYQVVLTFHGRLITPNLCWIIPLKPALGGVCSHANYSVAYEETQSNRVSDFRDCFVCSLFPKAILFNFYSRLSEHSLFCLSVYRLHKFLKFGFWYVDFRLFFISVTGLIMFNIYWRMFSSLTSFLKTTDLYSFN